MKGANSLKSCKKVGRNRQSTPFPSKRNNRCDVQHEIVRCNKSLRPKSAMGFCMTWILWAEGGVSACFGAHGRRQSLPGPADYDLERRTLAFSSVMGVVSPSAARRARALKSAKIP
jgi:hypothetical protein